MPDYSIKAPNGKTYRITGPEGATDEQVRAQVLQQFPEAGQAASAPKTTTRSVNIRDIVADVQAGRPYTPASQRKPKAAPKTRQQMATEAGQALARNQGQVGGGFGNAFAAATRRYMFGVPERLAAAAEAYLPSALTGNTSNASYDDILNVIRARTDAEMNQSTAGSLAGGVVGSIAGGRAVGGVLAPLATRAASAANPLIQRAGNVLQGLMTLKKGSPVANIAKLSTVGGAAGGAQAVGEGTDPVRGIATGAIAAPAVGGSLKLAQVLTRPVRDFLRTSSAGRIISRFTSSTAEEIQAKAAAYREATGAEPTVFELLPLADRNKILKQGIVGRDNIVERASNAIRQRAGNLGPEMRALTERTTAPQRGFIERGVEGDLAAARGGVPDPTDPALVGRAARSPTDMLELRDVEARTIMAPHENVPVAQDFAELLPQAPQNINGTIVMQDADPAVSAVIRSAAPAGFRTGGQGVTAGDITDMISTLRGDLGKGGIEARTAQRAIDHLTEVLEEASPDAGAAMRQMSDAYAARSRMAEGMQEGGRTRLRDEVEVGTSRRQARTVRNAYDTPEGAAGRALGQSNRILGDLSGAPEDALKATIKMSRGTSGRALAENLGPDEAARIMAGARAQDASAQALSAASQTAAGSGGAALDAEGLVQALAGLHPSSFATTKAGAIRKLLDMTYVPESRARTMVDMLFSQDPTMTARAIKAIGNSPNGSRFMQYLSGLVGQSSGATVDDVTTPSAATGAPSVLADLAVPPAGAETAEPNASAAPQFDPNVPYGRQVIESIFPGVEITEDVRDPNSELGRQTPNSFHEKSQNAVDVRPIPGMTFAQFVGKINDAGYKVIEAIDEVNNPSKYATGPHWHVVVAGQE